MQCTICGGDFQKKTSNSISILVCKNCGLGVTEQFKNVDYQNYHRDDTYLEEEAQFRNIFSKRVNLILQNKSKGNALDIGSSTGTFLSILQDKGWDVLGIEPSRKSADIANKKGINTLNKSFENVKLIKGSYDVVILNHILEHVDNPQKFIEKARELLKKDGIILIDVPNFGSLSSQIYGLDWKYLLPTEHKWHFTKKSLEHLLNKSGFRTQIIETHSGIWGYGNPFEELLTSFISFKKRFISNFTTLIPCLIISRLGLGTGLTIVAQKK